MSRVGKKKGIMTNVDLLYRALLSVGFQETCAITLGRKREQSTVTCMTMDCSSEEMLEVNQEEPKEEPVYDIVLPNSTSYVHSIASGVGAVIRHL